MTGQANAADMAHVYLPDSWVLAIDPGMNSVSFLLEAVLTADHPAYYWPPRPGEQYPYAVLRWTLRGDVHWNEGPHLDCPATDANGEIDFGNIDAWWQEGDFEHLSGEWGDVTIRAAQHFVEYVNERPSMSAMEDYLERAHGVVIAASDYLSPESVEDAVRLVENGEPPEALIQLAWAIVTDGSHVPGWIIDAIYELGATINDREHLPSNLRDFAE